MNKHKNIIVYLLIVVVMILAVGCGSKDTTIDPYGLSITVPGVWDIDTSVDSLPEGPGGPLEAGYKKSGGDTLIYTQYYDDTPQKTLGQIHTEMEAQGYTVEIYMRDFYVVSAWQKVADKYLVLIGVENEAEGELYTVILTLDAEDIDDIDKYIHDIVYTTEIK